MPWMREQPSILVDLTQIIDQVLTTQQANRQQYFQLMSVMLSDDAIATEQRSQINRIFDEVQLGRIKIAYW